jgi:hypothetical protein
MEDSGEDLNIGNPVILQHVVSGMVFVAIRHLPAIGSNRATYDEEYLSDDDDSATDGHTEEKLIIAKRDQLSAWIETFLKTIEDVLEYCFSSIHQSDLITKFLDENASDDVFGEQQQPDFVGEDDFDGDTQFEFPDGKSIRVDQWKESAGSVRTCLKEAEVFLLKFDDLTLRSIQDKSVEIENEVEVWLKSPVYQKLNLNPNRSSSRCQFTAIEIVGIILDKNIRGTTMSLDEVSMGDWRSESGQSRRANGRDQPPSTVPAPTVRDNSSVYDDSASQCMRNTKLATSPLHMLESHLKKFKRRDQKDKKSDGHDEAPWTFHIMSPKRILRYRKRLSNTFTSIAQNSKEPFLLSCRWSFSAKHEKVARKEGETSIMNTTLFGLEVFDLSKDELILIGIQQGTAKSETKSSNSRSNRKQKDIAIIPLGRLASGKGLEPQILSQMESQLFNVEFVDLKYADQIENGSRVSSIIRNFCSQLSAATEKREFDTYIAFLHRYHSRLSEGFDVVARSCVYDGFKKDCDVHLAEVDRQSQLFFGSLGIIQLVFSVIQVITFDDSRGSVNTPTRDYLHATCSL